LALLVLALTTAAACSSAPRVAADEEIVEMVTGLCAALAEGDVETSEVIFHDRSHRQLHTIATMLTEENQAALAGDLLRSKQRVEASYQQRLPSDLLHANLRSLIDVTHRGLEALDLAAPTCEELP
jgi:hypothetical protein